LIDILLGFMLGWVIVAMVFVTTVIVRFIFWIGEYEHDEIFTDLTRINAYKFCPNCGIRMVEPSESEDKE